jgi:GNAT superfamily N-acetyltransferase
MSLSIEAIGPERLAEYASVPSVVEVRSMFVVDESDRGVGRFEFHEQSIPFSYRKDYDLYGQRTPLEWPRRFDVSRWGFWLASDSGETIGGAAVARSTNGTDILDSRSDSAALWDIRVRPANQRHGVATALFRAAASWAMSGGCSLLEIETQNVNVAACQFYAKMDCVLDRIDRLAYWQCPEIADEVMLVWRLDLSS